MKCVLDACTVHYDEYGSGTPVVMIHGLWLDSRMMKGCMEPVFAGKTGWRRIYLDLPGMGDTKGEEWINSSDDVLQVVLDFLQRVVGEQRFLLVGESYGGYIARGVLAKRMDRVDGMALLCPVIVPGKEERDVPPRRIVAKDEALLAALPAEEAADFLEISVVLDAYNWERVKAELLPGARRADVPFLEKLKRNYAFSFDPDALPRPFDKPVLLLTGRQDHIVGYRDAWRILERYPRGTFAVLDRAGHNLQIEQPCLFNALVGEWLDRVAECRLS